MAALKVTLQSQRSIAWGGQSAKLVDRTDHSMKAKLLRGLIFIVLGYLALVAARFIYMEIGGDGSSRSDRRFMESNFVSAAVMQKDGNYRNYATLSYKGVGGATIDQKYEKVARVQSATEQFDDDEKRARSAVENIKGIIQGEGVQSMDGFRSLALTIGVPPGEFDHAVEEIKKIGRLESFSISKSDKTNDYLQLRAKRTSLEKMRDALAAIKGQGGSIDELVKLEREMLEIENKLQELGVQLGQFDLVNELCTVHFTLAEQPATVRRHPHFGNFLSAMAWASSVYVAMLASVALGLVGLVLAMILAQKAKSMLATDGK